MDLHRWLLQESSRDQEQEPYNCPHQDWSELTTSLQASLHMDCLHGPHPLLPFSQKETKTSENPMSYRMLEAPQGAGRDPGNTGSPGLIPCQQRPTGKPSLPAASRTHEGAQAECSGVLPADQAGPEQGDTPTVHLGERKLGQPLPETTSAYRKQVSLLRSRRRPPLLLFSFLVLSFRPRSL